MTKKTLRHSPRGHELAEVLELLITELGYQLNIEEDAYQRIPAKITLVKKNV